MEKGKLKFSEREAEIIQHRLDVSDCIIECLLKSHGDKFNEDQLIEAVDKLEKSLNSEVDVSDEAVAAVLWDCLDGSTYFASFKYEVEEELITESEAKAKKRTANFLEKKLEAVGIPVAIPRR